MLKNINTKDTISHASKCIGVMMSAYSFFMEHKLWKGFFRHKWIALATIGISILFSYWMICDVTTFFTASPIDIPINDAGIIADQMSDESKRGNAQTAISGGSKYLLLIILEIVIFYFSVKTIEILSGEEQPISISSFWKAEIRMIKVLIRGLVQAFIIQILLSILFGIIGVPNGIKGFVIFFVYAFFVGHAFFDNYNELYKLSIKKSEITTKYHFGATLALGTVASVLLLIPIIGPIVTPIFAALTANLYGYQYKLNEVVS
ncbi:MAG: hypothetical protein ACI9P5_003111 [Saprospiraceae bacterium]|jgi:hypothetical protein